MTNPHPKYDIFERIALNAYKKHFPNKPVKVNKHKHKLSPWITTGLIKSIEFRDKLYKQRVLTPGHQGWNDLHSLCRIGMEYYLLNNNNNNDNNDNNNDNNNNDDNNNNNDNNDDDDDDDNRNNNNDNDYNHNNDANNDNNDNDKTAQTPCQSLYKDRCI